MTDLFSNDWTGSPWWVLHVRSRQEKQVAVELAARGVPHFLPLTRQVRFYGPRKAVVETPLFPGYVFMRGPRDAAFDVDRNKRLVGILPVNRPLQLQEELQQIRTAIEAAIPLDPCPHLKKGVRVEVRSGPMRGLCGVVESRSRRVNRLHLQVEMLGRAVGVEIDGNLLDVIDEETRCVV